MFIRLLLFTYSYLPTLIYLRLFAFSYFPTLICLCSFALSTAVAPTVLLSPEEEIARTPKMQTLRRVTEQSMLRLLTVASSSSSSGNGHGNSSEEGEERLDIRGQRWHSGGDHMLTRTLQHTLYTSNTPINNPPNTSPQTSTPLTHPLTYSLT